MLRRFLLGATSVVAPVVTTWLSAGANAALKDDLRCADCGETKQSHELWIYFKKDAGPNRDGHMHEIDLCDHCLCAREDGYASLSEMKAAHAKHEAERVLKRMGFGST